MAIVMVYSGSLDMKQAAALNHDIRKATAYVTLEPCSHQGRTGPCADALIAAGVGRCVVATVDPNPLVSGGGLAKLKAAGASYYVRTSETLALGADDVLVRLVTSFATQDDDIERFVNLCGNSLLRPNAALISSDLENGVRIQSARWRRGISVSGFRAGVFALAFLPLAAAAPGHAQTPLPGTGFVPPYEIMRKTPTLGDLSLAAVPPEPKQPERHPSSSLWTQQQVELIKRSSSLKQGRRLSIPLVSG